MANATTFLPTSTIVAPLVTLVILPSTPIAIKVYVLMLRTTLSTAAWVGMCVHMMEARAVTKGCVLVFLGIQIIAGPLVTSVPAEPARIINVCKARQVHSIIERKFVARWYCLIYSGLGD